MKKVFALFTCILFLSSCSNPQQNTSNASSPQKDVLEQVIASKKLRAGYFIQPPAVMKNAQTGEVYGTFIDAISYIANEMDVELELIEVDLAKFTAGLAGDTYDVSVGPTFRSITRAQVVDFTVPLFYLGYDGVVKKGRADSFNSEVEIDVEGVTVAVKVGSAIHTYVKNKFTNATILELPGKDLSIPLQAVASNQADVGLMNEHTVEYFVKENPGMEIVLKDNPIQVLGMSWAVMRGQHNWRHFLNTSIEALVATGKMAEFERKHYGEKLRRVIIEPEQSTAR